jgi:hypothetical protein
MIPPSHLSTRVTDGNVGVLSIHLDGEVCRVGCEFCYLGARRGESARGDLEVLEALVERVAWDELAVAVSEPAEAAAPAIARLAALCVRRHRPLAITTTQQLAAAHPELLDGAARVNLSVDPRKGAVDPERIGALAAALHARFPSLDVVLIVSLIDPPFAERLIEGGLLARLVDLTSVDKVALNALKPPPPWCDRAFWLRALRTLEPLLSRALDTRLFLDCYVAARIVGLGGCPARADLSPAPGGFAFRACVYQPSADLVAGDPDTLGRALAGFTPPERCPFPIV